MRETPRLPWLPLLLIILVLVLLLLVFGEAGYLDRFEHVFHYVLDPLQRMLSRVTTISGDLFQTLRQVGELRAEVQDLRVQVESLTIENVRLREEYGAEVQQLRTMLNFANENPVVTLAGADVVGREDICETYPCGEIIGGEPNPYLRYVTINVGAAQGIKEGMTVIGAGAGLVGRVAEVGPRTAKVQLLNDSDSAVAAMLGTSRVTGLVVGQPDGTLRMEYIPQEEEITVGEIVLTSGFGGVMPKGLVIGQVIQVQQVDYALHQSALVQPVMDLSRLELVLVLTSFEQNSLDVSPVEEQ